MINKCFCLQITTTLHGRRAYQQVPIHIILFREVEKIFGKFVIRDQDKFSCTNKYDKELI